jgi:hypothetical protein
MALRSDPEYDYDILPQEYYANGGQWRKRSSIGKRQDDDYDILPQEYYANGGQWRKRSSRRNKNKELALKYYPLFFQ